MENNNHKKSCFPLCAIGIGVSISLMPCQKDVHNLTHIVGGGMILLGGGLAIVENYSSIKESINENIITPLQAHYHNLTRKLINKNDLCHRSLDFGYMH